MNFYNARMEVLRSEPRHEQAAPGPFNHIGGILELIEYTRPASVLEIGSHRGVSPSSAANTAPCGNSRLIRCFGIQCALCSGPQQ